jgi:hypothetical protein
MTIKTFGWSVCPSSEHDCLRILPSLSAHLYRKDPNRTTTTRGSSSSSGPHAASLSSALTDGWTEFILSAWRTFTPPTVTEDREQYFGVCALWEVSISNARCAGSRKSIGLTTTRKRFSCPCCSDRCLVSVSSATLLRQRYSYFLTVLCVI